MTADERIYLRDLAKKQLEIAKSPAMERLFRDWVAHGSFSAGARPMIRIELDTFIQEIIPPLMKCESPGARQIEWTLNSNIVNHSLFGDDTLVKDYYELPYAVTFVPFGIPAIKEFVKDTATGQEGLGHHFVPQLHDLCDDFDKLGASTFSIQKEQSEKEKQKLQDLLGDILPVRLRGGCQVASLTQNIVHLMSMENMFTAMYDYPREFHRMMEMLSDDYLCFFDALEEQGVLAETTGPQWLGQGTYCFTNELPEQKKHFVTGDIWIYMDSQETVGISPEMFDEFIFPWYLKIADRFGLVSYGCCEPVDSFYDRSISRIRNLKKLSISPWCNEEYMAERLKGKKIVYLRKPSPNLLGMDKSLDEEAVKKHIDKTVRAAGDLPLEFIQRDVYRVNHSPEKVRRFVELIRGCLG